MLSAILTKSVMILLQGSNTTSMLKEKLRAQLVHVAAAYSCCVLCIEGSPAFELSVMSAVDEIIALGRRCDLELCVLTACSPATLEVQCHKTSPPYTSRIPNSLYLRMLQRGGVYAVDVEHVERGRSIMRARNPQRLAVVPVAGRTGDGHEGGVSAQPGQTSA